MEPAAMLGPTLTTWVMITGISSAVAMNIWSHRTSRLVAKYFIINSTISAPLTRILTRRLLKHGPLSASDRREVRSLDCRAIASGLWTANFLALHPVRRQGRQLL